MLRCSTTKLLGVVLLVVSVTMLCLLVGGYLGPYGLVTGLSSGELAA